MRRKYNVICACVVVFSIFAFKSAAQPLSGLYTINSGLATGGTNFQTFSALAAVINTAGISGPVTINVVPLSGPYTEQPQFNAISGTSATNTITINGNGNLLTFNSTNSTQPWTLLLSGADFMNFNNLNVQGQGTTYAMVCLLTTGADYNVFSSCTFSAPANGTSSYQIPLCFSASNTGPSTGSNSGNNNTFSNCQMFSGYYCVMGYGLTGAPFQTGNAFYNCQMQDFYYYGMYWYYQTNSIVKGCTVERPTRTTLTTTFYGMMIYYNQNTICESNIIQNPYGMAPTMSGNCYCFYWYCPLTPKPIVKNTYRNNIVKNISTNGTIYGCYGYYASGDIYNNTFSLDDAGATGGTTYGMYFGGASSYTDFDVRNNLISITRGGSGSRYGIYAASYYSGIVINYNDIYVTGTGANHGYLSTMGTAANLAAWQVYGVDQNGNNLNPIFTNTLTDLHPTNIAMDNLAQPLGLVFDQQGAVRNQVTPDFGALEFNTPLCTGAPAITSISGPTFALCPGESAAMIIGQLIPTAGITYSWQSSSISNVGPFTPIIGANNLQYTAPSVTAQTWFSVVSTCTNPGGAASSPVIQVNVSGPTVSNIPYYEGMETCGLPNRLPNCSWSASNQGVSNCTSPNSQSGNRVARNGSSLGYFNNASPGTSAFYSNPINMTTGITYSAALYWATEYFGYNNWSNLQILIGPNQSATNATVVATLGTPISGPYQLLSGLFTVPSAGTYYMGIRATGAAGSAQYLSFDDLSITIPCGPGSPNSPTVTANASSYTVCEGTNVSLNATGADTYTWNTGSNVPSTSDNPASNGNGYVIYTVQGQNSITGCISTVNLQVYVNPAPPVFVVANPPVVCAGQPVSLSAYGANTYAWSNSSIGQNITVNPTTNTSYTVIGTNSFGCSTSYGYNVTVNALPVVSAISSNPGEACKDDQLTLTASGGVSYQWLSSTSSALYAGNPINISSAATTIFTVMATNANGCVGKTTLIQNINNCTGISKNPGAESFKVFPNPTAGEFSIEFNNNNSKSVEVTDVTGRVIVSSTTTESTVNVNIKNLAGGIYYVKVKSNDLTSVVKVVKQ